MTIKFSKLSGTSNYNAFQTTPTHLDNTSYSAPITSSTIEQKPGFIEDTSSYSAPITTFLSTSKNITETGPVFIEDTSSYSVPLTSFLSTSRNITETKPGFIDDTLSSGVFVNETRTGDVSGQPYSSYIGGEIETPALGDETNSFYTRSETGIDEAYGSKVLSDVGSVKSSFAFPGVSTTAGTLGMANISYGRSSTGMNKLKSDFQSDIQKTIAYLQGAECSNMINTISKYWVGPDADKFIKEVQKMLSQDASLFKTYNKTCTIIDLIIFTI